MSVLKEFNSLAAGTVAVGTPFPVRYRVTGPPAKGIIVVSCNAPYSAGPKIAVKALDGTSLVTITGPSGQATVEVKGLLVEEHSFPQDIE
jgi:hypothetical protein